MKNFLNDESGAVTVDFVVLTAGAVLIAVGAGTALKTKVDTAIGTIDLNQAVIDAATVATGS